MYEFIAYALITGIGIAVSCGILGPFLVLKNLALIGDGLSHVAFLALAVGMVLGGESSFFITIPVVVGASLFILQLNDKKIDGDSAIGMTSTFALALGVIIASINKGFSGDIFSFLFGSILFIEKYEMVITLIWSVLLTLSIIFLYNSLFAATYDEEFAKVQRIDVERLKKILAICTGITIGIGIKIIGTLLISALIVFPTVSAIQIAGSFKRVVIYSVLFAVVSVVLGILISYFLNYPTGATIVIVNCGIFFLSRILKKSS